MSSASRQTYRIQEFAHLAGVTVRALHHYDRLGLLRPSRTQSGYRAYVARDLITLEQIVALKFIGLPLVQIKKLLKQPAGQLPAALRAQRTVLLEKRRLLEHAIDAIDAAEQALGTGRDPDSLMFRRIIEVIDMQNKSEEWTRQYTALVDQKIERLKVMSSDQRAAMQEQWRELLRDIKAASHENPSGPVAQALANRWVSLLALFSPDGNVDPQLASKFGGVNQNLASGSATAAGRGSWTPPAIDQDTADAWEFMRKALAARQRSDT
jgi:DNA-binding transcriptional MerR regulator